jgi:hypothetical protein
MLIINDPSSSFSIAWVGDLFYEELLDPMAYFLLLKYKGCLLEVNSST